jgi:hypothetical protein
VGTAFAWFGTAYGRVIQAQSVASAQSRHLSRILADTDSPGEGSAAAQYGAAAPGQVPVSDRPSEKAMLTPAPTAVAAPVKNAVRGRWVASATAKMRQGRQRPVHQPAERRLDALEQERLGIDGVP